MSAFQWTYSMTKSAVECGRLANVAGQREGASLGIGWHLTTYQMSGLVWTRVPTSRRRRQFQ